MTTKRWIAACTLGIALATGTGSCRVGASPARAATDRATTLPAAAAKIVTLADATQMTELKVGTLPTTTAAALFVGMKQGFFSDEHLAVSPVFTAGGAALVPAILNGSIQIGFSADLALIVAASHNVPVEMIAPGVEAPAEESKDYCSVVVAGKSPIKAPSDLAGKTIAVNTLRNLGEITVRAALQKKGVDVSGLKFIEIPFPTMEAALEERRVDAIWVCEPFLTVTEQAGARLMVGTLAGTQPNMSVSTYFTSHQFARTHPDTVDAFRRAMRKSLAYAVDHPDVVRAVTSNYAKIPPAVANAMKLPAWPTELSRSKIDFEIRLAQKYGLINRAPDIGTLVVAK